MNFSEVGRALQAVADACTELGEALKMAQCGEILVAEGTCHPTYSFNYDPPGNPRNNTFSLKKDVDIYGGFAANDRNVLLGNVGIATPSAILYDQVAR